MLKKVGLSFFMVLFYIVVFAQQKIEKPLSSALSPMATLFFEEGPAGCFHLIMRENTGLQFNGKQEIVLYPIPEVFIQIYSS